MLQMMPTQSGQLLECLCVVALKCPRAEVQATRFRSAAQAMLGLSWLSQAESPEETFAFHFT